MIERYELHEWQWQLIRDLFPSSKATGRKRRDPRQMLNAIFWILCSGASWRDLPERYGPWQSVYHWYRIWTNDGTFDRIFGTPVTGRAGSLRSSPLEDSSMCSRKWPRIRRQCLVRRP